MIDVSCVLIQLKSGEILVTQRSSSMRLPFKWEFPGGKVEIGETAEACVIREIAEELTIAIVIRKQMPPHVYGEGNKAICLIPFLCAMTHGDIKLTEHIAYQWLLPRELTGLDWAPADVPVLNDYLNSL
jgi:8-oxo-dGTP diphosphatase